MLTIRLFRPGGPAAGSATTARRNDAALIVDLGSTIERLDFARVSLQAGGFDGRQWALVFPREDGVWQVNLEDPASIARFASDPPAALAAEISRLASRQRRGERRWRVLLGVAVAWTLGPILAVLALLALAGPLSAWLVSGISVETETRLGRTLFESQAAQLDQVRQGPALEAIETIGRRLSAGSAYDYRWILTEDPQANAYAMPGGIVVVHQGLIDRAGTPEQLAGVLAHEIEHVEQRHSLRALARTAALGALWVWITGDVSLTAALAGKLGDLDFSRDNETDADRAAVARLTRADIDPRGLAQMLERLREAQTGQTPPAWLSSHPPDAARIAALQALTADGPAFPPLAMDWR